ncbi:MAG: hypothetical protein WC864_08225 [Ilumatobacteraceae bacterium]
MNNRSVVISELVRRVKKQIATARVVGEFAVGMGTRRIGEVIGQVKNVGESETETETMRTVVEISESQLPIDSYSSLNAIEIITHPESLSVAELRAIANFERTHRMRRTVLFKIEQLLAR